MHIFVCMLHTLSLTSSSAGPSADHSLPDTPDYLQFLKHVQTCLFDLPNRRNSVFTLLLCGMFFPHISTWFLPYFIHCKSFPISKAFLRSQANRGSPLPQSFWSSLSCFFLKTHSIYFHTNLYHMFICLSLYHCSPTGYLISLSQSPQYFWYF